MIGNSLIVRSNARIFSALSRFPCQYSAFQQACPVSGTAKGKGKLKDGQQLKRSRIPKKNPKVSSDSRGRSHEANERLKKMVESSLEAPTPVRYLTAKQKWRESEREKLGLVSRDLQREIEAAKASAKGAEKAEDAPLRGWDLFSLGLVDKDKIPKYELTVEDGRRLAKEYSRVLMRKHRAHQAAESTLLRLQKEAIAALPQHLRAAALAPDPTPFPEYQIIPTLSPPIEGHVQRVKEARMKNVAKQKQR